MQVIIFPNNEGGVSVMSPALELADQIEAVAAKDVPAGLPWRIIQSEDLPPYEARSRWRWTDEGPLGVAEPEPELVPVPQVVSRFQARAALFNAGYLQTIEAAVAQADPFVQIAWADAAEFRRNSPTIAALSAAIGLSSEQIDDLFRGAALIEA